MKQCLDIIVTPSKTVFSTVCIPIIVLFKRPFPNVHILCQNSIVWYWHRRPSIVIWSHAEGPLNVSMANMLRTQTVKLKCWFKVALSWLAIFGYLAVCDKNGQVGFPWKEHYVALESLTFCVWDTPVKIDWPKLICGILGKDYNRYLSPPRL